MRILVLHVFTKKKKNFTPFLIFALLENATNLFFKLQKSRDTCIKKSRMLL